MTFIDFQIDAQRFLAAQRTYLRRLAVCPPALPEVEGVQIVLDRVDVGPSTLRHDKSGSSTSSTSTTATSSGRLPRRPAS